MTIEELVNSIHTEKESGNFTLQAIFDRHIEEIEGCKKSGISYKRIKDLLDLDIAESHFNNLIYRARKKLAIHKVDRRPKVEPSIVADTNIDNLQLKQSKNEWFNETGKDLSVELIQRLENHNIDTDSFNELGLQTTIQIITYLNEKDLSHKYK